MNLGEINLEVIRTELEKIGTITYLKEIDGKFFISISDVVISNKKMVDFLIVYHDYIFDFYQATEIVNFEGYSIKGIFSNDPNHMEDGHFDSVQKIETTETNE